MSKHLELFGTFKAVNQTEDEGKIFIEGYANTATKDRVGDLIPSSAWTDESIKNFMDRQPVMLFNHSYSDPIGAFSSVERQDKGLYVKGWIYKDWMHAQKVADGVLRSFSVHFNTDWSNWDWSNEMDCYVCKKIDDIYEISIATIPANADSTFTVAKSLGADDFEKFKKSHTNPKTMKEVIENLKSLFAKKKSGELTEAESKQLQELVDENSELLKTLMKSEEAEEEEETTEEETEEETTEETEEEEAPEETEAEKTLKAENARLQKQVEDLKKLKTAKSKQPESSKTEDPNDSTKTKTEMDGVLKELNSRKPAVYGAGKGVSK